MRYLTFALTKGRLAYKTLELLEQVGITCEEMKDKSSRKLIFVNEEKKLRRSYDTGGASDSEDSEETQPSTVLSLDAVPEDDVKASAWLESPEKMEEDIITGLLEQEFIRSLTKPQLEVYMNCMRGNMSMLSYAKQNGLSFSTVKDTRDAIRKKFKKIF